MKKFLLLVFAFFISASPVLAWGEEGCSFSNKKKASADTNTEKVEKSHSYKN